MTYEGLIQPVLWGLVGLGAALVASRALWARRKGRASRRPTVALVALAAAALVVVPSIGVVPGGHRGVIYQWNGGVNPVERGEGVTLLVPWVQHLRNISVRTDKVFSDKVFSQSLDLQEITVVASINYHIDPSKAAEVYQEVGPLYRTTVIQPALFQRTKAAIGKVKAEAFARNRGRLASRIQAQLTSQLSRYGIVVEFVNIEDAIFDKAFIAAVKAKIIAEQKAQEELRLVEAERAIKQQKIIQAEARARSVKIEADQQAEANLVLARSLSPELLRWRWLLEWNGTLPSTLVGSDKETQLLLGVYP